MAGVAKKKTRSWKNGSANKLIAKRALPSWRVEHVIIVGCDKQFHILKRSLTDVTWGVNGFW